MRPPGRHLRVLMCIGMLVALSATAARQTTGGAYALYGGTGVRWFQDYANNPCGQGSVKPWKACSIELVFDQSVSSRADWNYSMIDGAQTDWDITDPSRQNRQDWYYDIANSTYTNYTTQFARDLGGPAANGVILLGQNQASWYCLTRPCEMVMPDDNTYNTNSYITWCLSGAGGGCTGPDWFSLSAVAGHELGHALGLGHPTMGPSAQGPLMQCIMPNNVVILATQDDKNGVYHYYSGHPSDFPPPGTSPC